MSDIDTVDNAVKQVDELGCYSRECHPEDQRQHALGPQAFFIFIYHLESYRLKMATKIQEIALTDYAININLRCGLEERLQLDHYILIE